VKTPIQDHRANRPKIYNPGPALPRPTAFQYIAASLAVQSMVREHNAVKQQGTGRTVSAAQPPLQGLSPCPSFLCPNCALCSRRLLPSSEYIEVGTFSCPLGHSSGCCHNSAGIKAALDSRHLSSPQCSEVVTTGQGLILGPTHLKPSPTQSPLCQHFWPPLQHTSLY
jgi:hypothetical protein